MSTNLIWALIIVSIILLTISLFPQIMWATGSFNINESSARYVFLGLSLAGLLGLWLLVKSTPKLSSDIPETKPEIEIGSPILKKIVTQHTLEPDSPTPSKQYQDLSMGPPEPLNFPPPISMPNLPPPPSPVNLPPPPVI